MFCLRRKKSNRLAFDVRFRRRKVDDEKNFATAKTDFLAEVAKNRPLTAETLQKQLGRLGNTIFELEKINFDVDENLMIPISEINNLRRKAVEILERWKVF